MVKPTSFTVTDNKTLTQMGYVSNTRMNIGQDSVQSGENESVTVVDIDKEATPTDKKRPPSMVDITPPMRPPSMVDITSPTNKRLKLEDEDKSIKLYRYRTIFAGTEDFLKRDVLHPVFGYTKHWFELDYVVLKRRQVVRRLAWWRTQGLKLLDKWEDLYDQDLLDNFQHHVDDTIEIEKKSMHTIMWCLML